MNPHYKEAVKIIKIKKIILPLVVISILNTACSDIRSAVIPPNVTDASIEQYPDAIVSERIKLDSFPAYDEYSSESLEIDLRNCDLTLIKLFEKYDALLRADFDTRTIWPYSLPEGINPKEILETGKNPGPGIKQLHEEGVTGKGIGIAVIASPPLVEHSEYVGRIRQYREIRIQGEDIMQDKSPNDAVVVAGNNNTGISQTEERNDKEDFEKSSNTRIAGDSTVASYKGTAIASIIAGRTTGVAPGAVLYYFSPMVDMSGSDNGNEKVSGIIKSLDEIKKLNNELPLEDKIRAIVIENDFLHGVFMAKDYDKFQTDIKNILDAGILILSGGIMSSASGYAARCLGRNPLSAPDSFESYGAGYEWEMQFLTYNDDFDIAKKSCFLVQGDSRTTASPTGVLEYVFNRVGSTDFATAYLAGLYALACQTDPAITPESFIKAAIDTGKKKTVEKYGLERIMKYILDPSALIKKIEKE